MPLSQNETVLIDMHYDDDIEQDSVEEMEIENNGTIDADSHLEGVNSVTHQFRGLIDE
jgi:hypothetical protein